MLMWANWLAFVRYFVSMPPRFSTSSPAFHLTWVLGARLLFSPLARLAPSPLEVISIMISLSVNRSIYNTSARSLASSAAVLCTAISSSSLSRSMKLYFYSYLITSIFILCNSSFCFKNGCSSSLYHDSNLAAACSASFSNDSWLLCRYYIVSSSFLTWFNSLACSFMWWSDRR